MLSPHQVVAVRKAIELTYTGTCTIVGYEKVKQDNKTTSFQENIVLENQPCRLSFGRVTSANQDQVAATVTQAVKLFLAPEIVVQPGSKLIVTQNDVTTVYQSSGEPATYPTHQEIILELFKGWA